MDGLISGGGLKSGILRYAKAFVLLKDAHTVFKNNTTDLLLHMFCEATGSGGSEMGDVPRAEGWGHIFLRDPKGGAKNIL